MCCGHRGRRSRLRKLMYHLPGIDSVKLLGVGLVLLLRDVGSKSDAKLCGSLKEGHAVSRQLPWGMGSLSYLSRSHFLSHGYSGPTLNRPPTRCFFARSWSAVGSVGSGRDCSPV